MESSVWESKQNLRLQMKKLRASLTRDQVERLGMEITRRFFDSSFLKLPTAIALYAAIRHEVETEGLFTQCRQKGCRTFFPRLSGERLEFAELKGWKSLVPGRWGIPEPPSNEAAFPLTAIKAVFVPALAFDEGGARLGFGKGYFDAALRSYEGIKIGLAYDFQVLPAIPKTKGDLVCDWIVTETRVIRGAS